MIIKPRSQAPVSAPQGSVQMLSFCRSFIGNPGLTAAEFYTFFTTPSAERERFYAALTESVIKADEYSIIVQRT